VGQSLGVIVGCALALTVALTTACAPVSTPSVPTATPPTLLLGEFVDDYGSRYTVSTTEWFHHPAITYRIVTWNLDKQYAIAQNAPTNFRSAGLWTRIDWMRLEGMEPYEWAFCLSAYEAQTAEAAEATEIARRDTPKSGCNGFPFSRMRRVQ
jgi:hypothetical protein